ARAAFEHCAEQLARDLFGGTVVERRRQRRETRTPRTRRGVRGHANLVMPATSFVGRRRALLAASAANAARRLRGDALRGGLGGAAAAARPLAGRRGRTAVALVFGVSRGGRSRRGLVDDADREQFRRRRAETVLRAGAAGTHAEAGAGRGGGRL